MHVAFIELDLTFISDVLLPCREHSRHVVMIDVPRLGNISEKQTDVKTISEKTLWNEKTFTTVVFA